MTTMIQPRTADTWFSGHLMHYLDHLISPSTIDRVIGRASRQRDDARKVKHSWAFRIDGEPAAIWDYYGKRWSVYDPSGKLVTYLASHGLNLDAEQPSQGAPPTKQPVPLNLGRIHKDINEQFPRTIAKLAGFDASKVFPSIQVAAEPAAYVWPITPRRSGCPHGFGVKWQSCPVCKDA